MVVRSAQRSFVLLAATLALPLIVFVATTVYTSLENDRRDVAMRSLERARLTDALADSRVQADLTALRILATAQSITSGDWSRFRDRALTLVQREEGWRVIVLSDLPRGEEILSTQKPYSDERAPLRAGIPVAMPAAGNLVGGVLRTSESCPCVFLHLQLPSPDSGVSTRLLSVGVDPAIFQKILMDNTPAGTVSAIVDRDGNFIGRSVDPEGRVGRPATEYVRKAVKAGGEGFYEGTTYEGFINYTAYHTSPLSGWSTHIAAESGLVDRPRFLSSVTLVVATLLVLAAAIGLFLHARNELEERRSAENAMLQTQKLEALGRLTGGVAHDFNNLLTVIVGGLDLMLKREMDSKSKRLATHALEAAHRGERLVRQLLGFSRGQTIQIGPVDLRKLFSSLDVLLARTIGSRLELRLNIPEGIRWVTSDADQLELAIVNLALNSRDAMPDGGTLTISARSNPGDPRHVSIFVEDTGIGMSPEVAARALDPFFTTKPKGEGTGLGLPQVYGILRQSGGEMKIDSKPGRGTRVTLILPVADAPAKRATAQAGARQRRRILVVDDDEDVRGTMTAVLRDAGHVVVQAKDGPDALEMLRKSRPDLLLTDYSMPGMTGAELARHAWDLWVNLPIVIVSGYADAETIGQQVPRTLLLAKPFTPAKLVQATESAFRRGSS